MEAEAVAWTVEKCIEEGMSHVVIESDCLPLIQKLKSGIFPRGEKERTESS